MQKIGIVTLVGYQNFGNRLQNFAVQETLKKLGYESDTLQFIPAKKPFPEYFYGKVKHIIKNTLIFLLPNQVCQKIFSTAPTRETLIRTMLREWKLKKFTAQRIHAERVNETKRAMQGIDPEYMAFIVGSDQVWNPFFGCGQDSRFLSFASPAKRIAYAASFGVRSLPAACEASYSCGLSAMESISVREDEGAQIVQKLTGRQVPVLIDPTMMLTREEWLEIARPARKKTNKPYVLLFFLGEISSERMNHIVRKASEKDFILINISTPDSIYYAIGIEEFVSYIANAEVVFTDSFHGTVFSILFNKPFVTYARSGDEHDMSSRIKTLIQKFKLNTHICQDDSPMPDPFGINYCHVDSILSEERKKAIIFLENAINYTLV